MALPMNRTHSATGRLPSMFLIVLVMLAGLPAMPVHAATTLFVDPLGDDAGTCSAPLVGACKTISGAVGKATNGDTIRIAASTYTQESININKNVTLIGAGVGQTLIETTARFWISSGKVAISDMTFQNTVTYGALENSGTLNANNISIINNNSYGLTNYSTGTATITNANISGNGDSGVFNAGMMTLNNSIVSDNTSPGNAGGIYNANTLIINTSRVISNRSSSDSLYGSGGIYSQGKLVVNASTIGGSTGEGNVGTFAGGILTESQLGLSTLELNNSTVSGNRSTGTSSAYAAGGITIAGSTSNAVIRDSLVSGNVTNENGGGISNSGGSLTLIRSTVSGNRAGNKGYVGPSVGTGGGIFIIYTGSLAVDSSTISGNSAMGGGGGIALTTWNTATITNSTVSDNTLSGQYGLGTAISLDPNGIGQNPVTLLQSTITANTANSSSGVSTVFSTKRGQISFKNTILAGNTGDACTGELLSEGNNLFDSLGSCTFTPTTGDQIGVDPKLGLLQPNGGPTQTHALLAGSPALDTGDCASAPATDQRGVARPQGPDCDIGAHEAGPAVRLAFSTQPSGKVPPGAPFSTQPVVMAQDGYGNLANYNGPVTLALAGAGGLSGATTATAVKGVANFSGLGIDQPGTGYTIVASAPGLLAATSAPVNVSGALAANEIEPNNTVFEATPLVFDQQTQTALQGAITSATDADLYSFTVRPGAIATLNLTNLPADYDLVLLPDPRAAVVLSDSIDLGQIADISRRIPDTSRRIPDTGGHIPDIGLGMVSDSEITARSAQRGTPNEAIEAFLPRGGTYFVLVYSPLGGFSATPYTLDVALREGGLAQPETRARPVGPLALARDSSVKTIFLYNSTRMVTRYPAEADAVANLALALLPNRPLMLASNGVAIDLANPPVQAADTALLPALYNLWDAAPEQPLLANELAQQIFNLLDRAITDAYPNTSDIVIIGGDRIIPFYRIPDETEFANEREYLDTLKGALKPGSALGGTLFRGFIQTDNFYADRQPTPWRGRAMFLPDLGIGRLVERPSDIMRYLNGYIDSGNYTIDATGSSAAMVTGYDFLKDQAAAIAQQLGAYGLNVANTTLNNDTWGLDEFTNMWFGGQLPQLGANYRGIQTPFALTSLNGHFSHVAAIPANPFGLPFLANRLYTPTANDDMNAFFKINKKPTLIYTIGCHSGLSADDEEIATPALRADFPQAVLKQGGNWIGNTGYGYGDAHVVGYSERLSLLFTRGLGRDQAGRAVSIGEALAYAKRQYLKTSGGGSFSVYDEKVLEELTLYGLPFMRVALPPHPAPESDDSQPMSIPADIRATLAQPAANGVFTRVITMTNTFATLDASGLVGVTSVVQDSFGTTTLPISGVQQTASGKPVLPLLTYDITLRANPSPLNNGGVDGVPTPRGVRLRSATTLPDKTGFTPRITNTITDQLGLAPQTDPQVGLLNTWLPALPYIAQRTSYQPSATEVVTSDKLLVFPAQFSATTGSSGQLRRFTQMVFEITYIDPRSAPATIRAASAPPTFDVTQLTLTAPAVTHATRATGSLATRLSAAVQANGNEPLQHVSAIYTVDGRHWSRQPLILDPATGRYQTTFATTNGRFSALLEAIDGAGNVTTATNKGTLFTLTQIDLPALSR